MKSNKQSRMNQMLFDMISRIDDHLYWKFGEYVLKPEDLEKFNKLHAEITKENYNG